MPYDNQPASLHFGRFIQQISSLETTPFYFDCNWVDAWVSNNAAPPPNLKGGNDGGLWRVAMNRHNNGINIAYADGHAANVPVTDLMSQTWHKGWVPKMVAMPSK